MNASVLMEICKLKSGLNDIQRIGDDGTNNSCCKRMQKVVACMLIFSFEVFKCTEKRVTS